MRRFNVTKKVVVGVLSVIMAVTMLFTGEVDAGAAGASGPTDEELQEMRQRAYESSYLLISENDIAVFSDEISHYKLTLTSEVICPNNTAYHIEALYRLSPDGYDIKITGAEFDNAVAQAANLPYDKSLDALGYGYEGLRTLDIDWVYYLSRDLIVIDENTSIFIPGQVAVNDGYSNNTDFVIRGRKSDGSWDTLITTWEPRRRWNNGTTAQDMTIKGSDFMKDEYVYYAISTTQGTEAAAHSTEVEHIMVTADNLEAYSKHDDVSLTPKTVDIGPEGTMYRMYNENSGEHFYTANSSEAQGLSDIGWNYEGHAWLAPTSSQTPVYRVYNPNSGEHHYTSNVAEKDNLVSIGWNDEGIGFYSDDVQGVPMYRLYNPNAKGEQEAGAHHYTKDVSERDSLKGIGWQYEGISWYGV